VEGRKLVFHTISFACRIRRGKEKGKKKNRRNAPRDNLRGEEKEERGRVRLFF